MRRSIMIGLLAATLSAGGSGAKAANLLGNGDFETPLVPAGSFTLFSNGQAIGAWTVAGATGNVGVVSGTFSQVPLVLTAVISASPFTKTLTLLVVPNNAAWIFHVAYVEGQLIEAAGNGRHGLAHSRCGVAGAGEVEKLLPGPGRKTKPA